MADRLLDDERLERSSVVANCAMNRERQLSSYTKELGFNPLDRVLEATARSRDTAWLDLCCGSGRPLLQAAERAAGRVRIVGVDLVEYFAAAPPDGVELVCASVATWTPERRFDLITCVHGLHYVGDKLGVVARAASWLAGDGSTFVADLDLGNVRFADGHPAGRQVAVALRRAGFEYNFRRHRVSRTGRAEVSLPFRYVGADDRAGANYTGQPVVDSYYEPIGA